MFQLPSKRQQIVRRVITYTFMVVVVILLSIALLLLLLGYRFNRDSGTLVQGGLVQFISQPSGARVTVGPAQLANPTRSKITLYPGDYDVSMTLDGYQPWKKRITVKAGTVLWLNSARFVPNIPETIAVEQFSILGSMAVRPGGQYIALMEGPTKPSVTIAKISGDTPTITRLELPSSAYTAAKSHSFSLSEWSSDDQYVLIKHLYDKQTEWLAFDRTDASKSRLIPAAKTSFPTRVIYDPHNSDQVIALYNDGSVNLVNLAANTVKPLPLKGVQSLDMWNSTLFYTAKDGASISTGYLTLGSTAPRVVQSYETTAPVEIAGSEYFGAYYIATSVGKESTVASLTDLPDSASSEPLQMKKLHTVASAQPVNSIDFHSGGRFVVIGAGTTQITYDIELDTESTVPILGLKKPLATPLRWLDDYHFWSDANGSMRQYEFDGSNQTDVVKVAPGFKAVYSSNNKYLYTIGKTKDGYQLQQTRMIIN